MATVAETGQRPAAATSALPAFAAGQVIPAQPLALDARRRLDETRQRALSRYYLDAGAGGIAVAVHSTQFAIHDTHRELLRPVLSLAADEVAAAGRPDTVLIAGVNGTTDQAVAEAELAAELGYHAVLCAPYGLDQLSESQLIDRTTAIGEVLPVIGFYLQERVGGRYLSRNYWRALSELEPVIGIKVAPFDRYRTTDVLWAVARSSRADDIALYTGNDDHIIGDLLLEYPRPGGGVLRFVGGLLGQWSLWTLQAVQILQLSRQARDGDAEALAALRRIDLALTDANGAIFDVANDFAGCIPGIHEVLRRQGLLDGRWCLDPSEELSSGQSAEIDRVLAAYPELQDDGFVSDRLSGWLASATQRISDADRSGRDHRPGEPPPAI